MKIAIAGYGMEGKASYLYWNTPEHEVTIVDESSVLADTLPAGAQTMFGDDVFAHLDDFELVIRTAGLPPAKIQTSGKIWSATNEFFSRCPAPIIGVTGTKGKGTTASLIESILRSAGKTVHLVGNIGTPALNLLPTITADDIVVFELSSFQLWDLEKSPQVAVVLMIEPDHLNVHANFDEYIEAKANIRRFQSLDDACFYHPTNSYSHQIATTSDGTDGDTNSAGWGKRAMRFAIPDDGAVYVKSNTFFVQDVPICSLDALQLPGVHNIENACAAISAVRLFSVDNMAIEQGLRDFEGLPHRLELVREVHGVTYYNDSFSSAPGATVAALRSFDQPEIVILGGIDKGADFSELVTTVARQDNIKKIIIMGEIRQKLASLFENSNTSASIEVTDSIDLQTVVAIAVASARPGDVVLLSPGCASFDMFKNFYDRGDQFRSIVTNL